MSATTEWAQETPSVSLRGDHEVLPDPADRRAALNALVKWVIQETCAEEMQYMPLGSPSSDN